MNLDILLKDGTTTLSNGTLCVMKDGKFHCEDGPAVMHEDGTHCWYINGLLHNDMGPAMIKTQHNHGWSKGTNRASWYIHGRKFSFARWCFLLDKSDDEIRELEQKYNFDISKDR